MSIQHQRRTKQDVEEGLDPSFSSSSETSPLLLGASSSQTRNRNPETGGEGNDADEKASSGFIVVLTLFAAIGGYLFGYDTGVVSGAMLLLKDRFDLSDQQQELVVSITVAGAIVGSILGGKSNDIFGRRKVIMFADVVFTVGAVLMAFTNDWILLLVGRGVVGLGIGFASMTVPMYLAEVAPPKHRGTLTVVNNLFITGGQFIAGLVAGAFSTMHRNGWRYMLGLAAIPSVLQFFGFLYLPESPRWLVRKGRLHEAELVLKRIYKSSKSVSSELEDITSSFEAERGVTPSFSEILNNVALRRALIIACGLQAFQQLSGINTVMYYSATILEQAGVANKSTAIWYAALIAGCNFLFTLVGLYFVEKSGRRKLLLGSLGGVVISLAVLGLCFKIADDRSPLLSNNDEGCGYGTCKACSAHSHCGFCSHTNYSLALNVTLGSCLRGNSSTTPASCEGEWMYGYCPNPYSWLAILCLGLYIAFFASGMGPMPWTVQSEIFPSSYRSFGNSCATAVNWMGNLLISMTFLDLINLLTESGAFWLYAGCGLLALLFVLTYVPETKGVPLEEIEALLLNMGQAKNKKKTELS